MADVLNLALSDYTDTASKIDLLNGVFRLQRGGWQPKTATPQQSYRGGWYGNQATFEQFAPVQEVIDLLAEGTPGQLIAAQTAMEAMLDKARMWPLDPTQKQALWLEWSTDGEPGAGTYAAKRAFIHAASLQMKQPAGMRGGFLDSALYARLALTRHPFWENLGYDAMSTLTPSSLGGKSTLTSYADGTAPGRLEYVIASPPAASGYYFEDYWIGIREEGHGITEFEPVWELEDGTNGTDTSDVVDATASGGYKSQCTFSTTATLASRSTMTVDEQLTGKGDTYDEHYIGRYLVLCRLQVGASTVCGVRLDHGVTGAQYQLGNEVYVENTSWELVELGEISIPPGGYKDAFAETDVNYVSLRIMAERLSGSNSLDLDCLILVPSAHLLVAHGLGSGANGIAVWTRADDRTIFHTDASPGAESASLGLVDWYLPVDPGCLVFAAQRSAGHTLTDSGQVNIFYVPRWFSYRRSA